jgi:hypothetical protein
LASKVKRSFLHFEGSIRAVPCIGAAGSSVKTVAKVIIVPVRMAKLVLQGKNRAADVVKPDQFTSPLHIGLAFAEKTGTDELSESALDRNPPLRERGTRAPAPKLAIAWRLAKRSLAGC